MEIRTYLRILSRRWWAIALGFGTVVLATAMWTVGQTPTYRSRASYVIRPHSSVLKLEDDFVRALEIVSRRVEINTTFGEVAASQLIKSRAILTSDISREARGDYSVSANVVGGTNILEIAVEGPDPEKTAELCSLVGAQTLTYVKELYDVYELHPLDPASTPKNPIRPNLPLNLGVSSILGLTLGAGLAFMIEVVRSPFDVPDNFNIIDRATGAYNKSYFTLRLWQEMNRSKRHKYPLSLGLIKVEIDGEGVTQRQRTEVMRVFKKVTDSQIRGDDVLAWINGDTFAVLCAYMPNDKAKDFVERLKGKFAPVAMDVLSANGGIQVKNYSTVVTYNGGFIDESGFLEKGVLALEASTTNLTSEG